MASSDELAVLAQSEKVILSPHIAGWTHEAQFKMADVLCSKILGAFE
jgi:D-3-phosphoglycerate dehydrogenase